MLVLLAENISASEFLGQTDTGKKWARFGYLWRSSFTSSEWRGLTDTIRARVSRRTGPVDISLAQEDGSPVSPTDSFVITDISSDLTSFDIRVSLREDISYDAEIPFSSIAGRLFRDIAFTPDWHAAMLLLHSVPYIRATGGEIRYQLGDGTLAFQGYMLAHLDNAFGLDQSARLELYEAYASAMAASPQLQEQLLERLRREISHFTVASVIELMRKMNISSLTQTSAEILNVLWESVKSDSDRQSIAQFVSDVHAARPGKEAITLNEKLRNLADHLRGG
jgi:hypothetical protein